MDGNDYLLGLYLDVNYEMVAFSIESSTQTITYGVESYYKSKVHFRGNSKTTNYFFCEFKSVDGTSWD